MDRFCLSSNSQIPTRRTSKSTRWWRIRLEHSLLSRITTWLISKPTSREERNRWPEITTRSRRLAEQKVASTQKYSTWTNTEVQIKKCAITNWIKSHQKRLFCITSTKMDEMFLAESISSLRISNASKWARTTKFWGRGLIKRHLQYNKVWNYNYNYQL